MQNTIQTCIFALCLGFLILILIYPISIKLIKKLKAKQPILNYVEAHQNKSGTLTMGGLIFIFATLIAFLFFASFSYFKYSLVVICCFLGFGMLGFLDDFIKVKCNHNEGLKPYQKIIGQVGIATIVAVFCFLNPNISGNINIPFSNKQLNLGWGIIPFCVFVFVAISNSVNLTDGLDGLAGGVSASFILCFIVLTLIYLFNLTTQNSSEEIITEYKNLLIICSALFGSLLAFLCFNGYPAKIFMGDTGSLALGGFISGILAVTKNYLLMPILGFVFVLTAFSVIVQVLYYKLKKKRVFLMAPIHHHFEMKGIFETKIVLVYVLITLIVGFITIALYL